VETEVTAENAVNLADIIADPNNNVSINNLDETGNAGMGTTIDWGKDISNRTVYVTGEVDYNHYTLYANGNTKLVICDGTVAKIHHIIVNGALHIYGQKNETGRLLVNEARTSNGRVDFRSGFGDVLERRVAHGATRRGIRTICSYCH
jgi:hypothetical protein